MRFIDKNIADELIAANVKSVEKHGFVNYFGMQRFGTYSVRTHLMGKTILNQDWKEVIRLILIQHADYEPEQKQRKERLVSLVFNPQGADQELDVRQRIEKAIDMLDRRDRLEKTVLMSLKNKPQDY